MQPPLIAQLGENTELLLLGHAIDEQVNSTPGIMRTLDVGSPAELYPPCCT